MAATARKPSAGQVKAEGQVRRRDKRIAELEVNLQHLKAYSGNVARQLEIQRDSARRLSDLRDAANERVRVEVIKRRDQEQQKRAALRSLQAANQEVDTLRGVLTSVAFLAGHLGMPERDPRSGVAVLEEELAKMQPLDTYTDASPIQRMEWKGEGPVDFEARPGESLGVRFCTPEDVQEDRP